MRKEKQLLLDEVKEKIEASQALIVASYEKLEPNASWILRETLAKAQSQFEVVKKRILVKAAEKSGIHLDEAMLEGHIGIVLVDQKDSIEPAKVLIKFSKESGNLMKILCGQVEGNLLPGAEIEELSELPTLSEIRAMLIGLLTSPMSQMLSVVEAAIAGPLSVIEEKSKEKD